ncbi:VOC family protein [Tardiphaga alba]|uniref:VOC family protein n=1 Tax=Tardiphaga alba TaxID=340268 RepID=A0ABX8ABL1_9BRAD|nr:VOC family protein [Tardiphaga alba]QUS41153.1 VOC family protein [Tardiphaga alba]
MTTRRAVLKLAAFAASNAALLGAVRAEGGGAGAVAAPLPFAQQTPMRIGTAALRVRDLGIVRRFYTDLLKLTTISEGPGEVVLGVDGVALLHLIHRPTAPLAGARGAGLYHTAFLMPSRADFARWLVHAALTRTQFTGFADHHVSEASYLDDPEGNGIEVYSDRPTASWLWVGDSVSMGSDRLDIDDIVKLTDTTRDQYDAAPKALRIGHMHLRVGDVMRARAFYEGVIGMERTRERGGAAFLSSGRYHHHLGINVWQSEGAGARDVDETGLAWFSLAVADDAVLADRRQRLAKAGIVHDAMATGFAVADPWGTQVRVLKA